MGTNMDLSTIFRTVTEQLASKKEELNEADGYNHDHGDHMVQIFDLVQNAVASKSNQPVADQLDYASKVVEKEAVSGSGKLYAQGLSNAAKQFTGSNLNSDNVSSLVKSLLNVEQPAVKPKSSNIFGSLLSGLMGKSTNKEEEDQKLGIDDLLRSGMAYYQSKQNGESNSEAIMDAVMAASPMGQSAHRSQSGSIVASTILNIASSLNK